MAKNDKKAFVQEKPSGQSENVKKFKQSPMLYIGSIVILVLVVVTFIGGDFITGGGCAGGGRDLTFGYYNKAPVTWVPGNMFNIIYNNVKYRYQMYGYDVSNSWMEQQIMREAFDDYVEHIAILQILKRSNYEVPESKVDREMLTNPRFLDKNENFSDALYRNMSKSDQMAVWQQEKEKLGKRMYINDLLSLLIPKAEADFIAAMSSPARNFDVVSFNVDDYPESEYISFANENSNLFNTIHLSKITVTSSEREAKSVHSSVKSGMTFEDAARNHSTDNYKERGGDMGVRYYFEIEQEVPNAQDREKVLNLKSGEMSDVIKIGNGWVFFKVLGETMTADINDETVMERVRWYVSNYSRGRMEDWAINTAREFITDAKETDFADASYARNLERQNVGPISINYGNVELFTALAIPGVSQQDISDLSRNETFWKNLFSAQIGTPCEPLVQGSNVYVFLPTDQIDIDGSALDFISDKYSNPSSDIAGMPQNRGWIKLITEYTVSTYFLKHQKMDDRFDETYKKLYER